MQYCDRIEGFKKDLQDRENEFLLIKVLDIQTLPYPSPEKIQKLAQDIQSVSADEEKLESLIALNSQQKSVLASLYTCIENLTQTCRNHENEIQENSALITLTKDKISETSSVINQFHIEQQETNSKISEFSREVSELTEKIEPKRKQLEALRTQSDSIKSQHSFLASLLTSLKDSKQQLSSEISFQERELERLMEETEKLICEKNSLQTKKNEMKSFESSNPPALSIPKPRLTSLDICPVCLYPKVGRVKICKLCGSVVHQKCMQDFGCFNCNMANK